MVYWCGVYSVWCIGVWCAVFGVFVCGVQFLVQLGTRYSTRYCNIVYIPPVV
jgi:hypothetical protein